MLGYTGPVKMIADVLSLVLILSNMSYCGAFQYAVNLMSDIENILNNDELFGDTAVTSKESDEQERRWGYLNCAISKGKMYLLSNKNNGPMKGFIKLATKPSNKVYTEYKQRELNGKGKKTGKALGKHAISLNSSGIPQLVQIRDVKKLY